MIRPDAKTLQSMAAVAKQFPEILEFIAKTTYIDEKQSQ